jgi:hypothetical protein
MNATLVVISSVPNRPEVSRALADYADRPGVSFAVSTTETGFEVRGKRSVLDLVVQEFGSTGLKSKALLLWEK